MHVMSEEEWKAFLTAEPPHTGKLATVRKDGRPHVAPIWFDLDEVLVWATRIGGLYMGAENAEAYGRRNAVPGELLVRLRPTHVVARAGIAD
jgi:predicted pyridoxine 5'-phosphate oxidase superfamily flavin-nucleotide-binding protein